MSVQKALLPGLWSVMDSGGHGSAKVIYPCFLPLLSQLVDKVTYMYIIGKWDNPLPFVMLYTTKNISQTIYYSPCHYLELPVVIRNPNPQVMILMILAMIIIIIHVGYDTHDNTGHDTYDTWI